MEIKAAIFDMDGTLVDSLMVWDVLWSRFGSLFIKDEKFRPSEEDDKKVRTLKLNDAMDLIHKNYDFGKSGSELLKIANEIMIEFYSTDVKLKKGVKEFLENLKANGVKMCIASATAPDLLAIALQHCGIDQYFSKVFSCGVLGKGKDVPDIYWMAQEYLETSLEETWVFEDSLVALQTAAKAGFSTVGIYDRFNYGQEEIRNLVDVYIAPGETLRKLLP
jgi:HAD superfamily hydrolase (TIGR01509 family)